MQDKAKQVTHKSARKRSHACLRLVESIPSKSTTTAPAKPISSLVTKFQQFADQLDLEIDRIMKL